MKHKSRAFTLIEILIVSAMACIIFTAGIAPLMFTVRSLGETRRLFTAENRERAAFDRMAQDIREAVLTNQNAPIRITKSEEMPEKPRSALVVWSISPAYQGLPIGSVIYAIPRPGLSDGPDASHALKRLVLSKDMVRDADMQALFADGEPLTMIPDIEGVTIEALRSASWEDEYTGGVPQAIRVTFEYKDRESVYETWFPNAE